MIDKSKCEQSLREFVEAFWLVLEPTVEFVPGWPLDAVCQHLQAATEGKIKRLLILMPSGFGHSLLTSVFWPAWEWGPRGMADRDYLCASYSDKLTQRDNIRFRDLVASDAYRELWGDRYALAEDEMKKGRIANNKRGAKIAAEIGNPLMGLRVDRLIVDLPNSINERESETIKKATNAWFMDSAMCRVGFEGAVVVTTPVMAIGDLSDYILRSEGLDFECLSIQMEYDPERHCRTAIGWSDQRGAQGDLVWPERFSQMSIDRIKSAMHPEDYAALYNQLRPLPPRKVTAAA